MVYPSSKFDHLARLPHDAPSSRERSLDGLPIEHTRNFEKQVRGARAK